MICEKTVIRNNARTAQPGTIHSVGIAALKVVASPEKVRTVLGSCVGIAVFDPRAKVGGIAHVLLPTSTLGQGDRGKFADTAVDWLIEELLKAGCNRQRLNAKMTGGASMFGDRVDGGIGERNVVAVRDRLIRHGIRILAEDVGGVKGRKMLLDPETGEVEVQFIGSEPRVI